MAKHSCAIYTIFMRGKSLAAAILGLTLSFAAVPAATAACMSAPFGNGQATYYTGSGVGACGVPLADSNLAVAVSTTVFQGSAMCGRCVQITGPSGTITAPVVDSCPTCGTNDLDLSPTTFAAIGTIANGAEPVSWQTVECPVAGSMSYQFQSSNAFFLNVMIRNHRYGVAGVSVQPMGAPSFSVMTRSTGNTFTYTQGAQILFPIVLRLTDTNGATVDDAIAALQNDIITPGSAQFPACNPVLFVNGFESPN